MGCAVRLYWNIQSQDLTWGVLNICNHRLRINTPCFVTDHYTSYSKHVNESGKNRAVRASVQS